LLLRISHVQTAYAFIAVRSTGILSLLASNKEWMRPALLVGLPSWMRARSAGGVFRKSSLWGKPEAVSPADPASIGLH